MDHFSMIYQQDDYQIDSINDMYQWEVIMSCVSYDTFGSHVNIKR